MQDKTRLTWKAGGKPSPLKFVYGGGALPVRANLKYLQSPVHDQANAGSCTGNAIASALEYLQLQGIRKHIPDPEDFPNMKYDPISRLFIYYNERLLEGTTYQDAGATVMSGMTAVQYYGFCQESTWPYHLNNLLVEPSSMAYQEAQAHKAARALNVATLTDIKAALAGGSCVVFGTPVYQSFMDVDFSGVYPGPNPGEQPLGGHCMLIVAYDDYYQSLTIKNSWGTVWGHNGYGYVSYNWANSDFADMHVID